MYTVWSGLYALGYGLVWAGMAWCWSVKAVIEREKTAVTLIKKNVLH